MVKAGFKVEKKIVYKEFSVKKSVFCCFGTKHVFPFENATDDQPDASLVVMRFD
jgi:hypothetical protein